MSFAEHASEVSVRLMFEKTCSVYPMTDQPGATPVFSPSQHMLITLMATADVAICQGANPQAVFPEVGTVGNDVIPAGNKVRTVVSPQMKLSYVLAPGSVGNLYINLEGAV